MRKKLIISLIMTVGIIGATSPAIAHATEGTNSVIIKENSTNGWVYSNGDSYYYVNGTAQTGWINDGYDDYFLDKETGVMQTGWINDGYDDYFLDKETGVMQTGWINDGYDDYFLDKETGVMQTVWANDGYDDYFLDKETGVMQTGWTKSYNEDYYLNSNGVMHKGWLKSDAGFYYLSTHNGVMIKGRHKVDNVEYWQNDNGLMKADEWIGNIYINSNGVVKEITRADASSDIQYKMFMDMVSLANRETVHQEAINLHDGITNNNCVFFMSEILRRAGISIPDHIGYTTKLETQLVNRGWKKNTNLNNLRPGDIVYAGNKYGYTHVYLFMGWAEDGYAYIVDNQKSKFGEVLHKRQVFESDEINSTDYSINYYTYN